MSDLFLAVKRLSPEATLPVRKTPGAAGYDLAPARNTPYGGRTETVVDKRTGQEVEVPIPGTGILQVETDLVIVIPPGHYGRIAPRSGLAIAGWEVRGGVIDCDYRGPVVILLCNPTITRAGVFHAGERVAQLILEKIITPPVREIDEVPETERGAGGFGSTG